MTFLTRIGWLARRLCRVAGMAVLLLLSAVSVAAGAVEYTVQVATPDFHQRVARGVGWLEDRDGDMTLAQLRAARMQGAFAGFDDDALQFGYSSSTYWISFDIVNALAPPVPAGTGERIYMAARYPLLDEVQLFVVRDRGVEQIVLGDARNYFQRLFLVNDLVFPLTLTPGERVEIFLRVRSENTLSIPIYVYAEAAFVQQQSRIELTNGIYFGISAGLFLYNLFLWIGVRKRVYGIYVLFMALHLLFNATMLGYTFALWPNALRFQQVAIFVFSLTSGAAVVWFGMAFLQSKTHLPRWHWLLRCFLALTVIAIPIVLLAPPSRAAELNGLVMIAGIALLLPAAVMRLRQGYRPAWYYLVGQGAVLASVGFTVLTSRGLLPYYHLAPEVLKWSSAFEILFFSIGLADLVNEERRLREAAQHRSEASQRQLLQVQIQLNEELDRKVRERTQELERANDQLQLLSTTDELTRLYNRRFFNAALQQEYRRACRDRTSLSVLMLDIDYFKRINDEHGHLAGDAVLVHAASMIAARIRRPPDVAARFGGEEFVVMLPNTNVEGARVVADNILRAFNSDGVALGDNCIPITVSIGIAGAVPTERDGHEQLLAEADRQLYLAKQGGRNRCACVDTVT